MSSTRFKAAVLLILFLCLGMWWLVSWQYSMKWDIMDITLPWNHFISECIRSGDLPLWNPYLKNGFPMMGLPDTWYPITWIISFLFGMDVWAIQMDYLLHLFIGGFGFYSYAKFKGIDQRYSLALGVCYMFSGFMVGNAQHLGWIIGAAWLPWVVLYFDRVIEGNGKAEMLKLALVSSLLFYGAYPPITIILFYVLLAKMLFGFITKSKKLERKAITKIGLSFLLFLLISIVGIVGLYDLTPHLNRGGQLPLSNTGWGILTGFLPAKAISSFVIPYGGTSLNGFWGSDISLINCYCGFLTGLITVTGLLAKNKKTWFAFLVGLLFLMIAMSELFPFRSWLYYLPLFDKFRFPSLFRMFGIFFLLLASGYAYNDLGKSIKSQKYSKIIIGLVLIVFLGSTSFNWIQEGAFGVNVLFESGLQQFNKLASFEDKACINFFILSIVVGALFVNSLVSKNWLRHLPFFVIVEILIMSQFNISETVIHFGDPSIGNKEIQNYKGKGLSIDLTMPMITFDDGFWSDELRWFRYNQASITKTPSASGNSPFTLLRNKEARENGDIALNNNPLFFFADTLNQKVVESSINMANPETIRLISTINNDFKLQTNNDEDTNLIMLQNSYPGWKATVDGIPAKLKTVNTTFISLPLKAGPHEVNIYFDPRKTIIAFWISLISFIMVLIGAFWLHFKEAREEIT